mgnify:CR=1 FL=1
MWLMPPFYMPLRGRWWAPLHDSGTSYDKTGKPRLWRYRQNMQTRLRLWEMHPYPRFAVLAPGGVHSEHDLEERSDAQIIVSRFTFRWKF